MTLNAILAMAYRDLLKLVRDPARLAFSFVFPLLFVGIFGPTMQANLGTSAGYDLLVFIFTGVYAQTLFLSTASGVVSLLEDRENDFSQEIFVSPISRYAIVFGKIAGETLVAMPQGLAVLAFGLVLRVPMTLAQVGLLALVGPIVCLFGGAFGIMLLSSFSSQRTANQIVPFVMLPQYFLAGVFTPIKRLPLYLDVLSRLSPMRYAVDLGRSVFYAGKPEFQAVVLQGASLNFLVIAVLFALFMLVGTFLFVRAEQNR